MASATTTPGLSDAQLVDFLALTKGADSVELKLTVPIRTGAGRAQHSESMSSRAKFGRCTSSTHLI